MEEKLKIELDRLKMTNYILQKENELLIEKVGVMANELENTKKTISYRVIKKIKNIIRR